MKKSAAILLAIGLSVSGLAGVAQAAGRHAVGGHFGGSAGHFSGHGGGHYGGHHGGYGYGGYGYGLGFGLGLGALYYGYPYWDGYDAAPYAYPDDAAPPPDAAPGDAAPTPVPGFWYRCDSPAGFYPYVQTCAHPWQAVPAVPPPQQDSSH